jgi:hypothetical protein
MALMLSIVMAPIANAFELGDCGRPNPMVFPLPPLQQSHAPHLRRSVFDYLDTYIPNVDLSRERETH